MARMGLIGALLAMPVILGGASPSATPFEAQQTSVIASQCPDPARLNGLCRAILEQGRVSVGNGRTNYEYAAIFESAACVEATDNPDEIVRKVGELWRHQENLACTAAGFNIADGNVLKYAVRTRTFNFLNLAVERWHLDFNIPDPSDHGNTLLDYVQQEARVNANSDIGTQLLEYYAFLREASALHCRELPDTSACQTRRN